MGKLRRGMTLLRLATPHSQQLAHYVSGVLQRKEEVGNLVDKVSTKFSGLDRSLVEEELQRLIESPGLQHAESLCLLLRYLVEHALDKPQEHVKEYQIAVDVFGRSESFDPRLDSTI